jgi:hypothetical protein
VRKMPLYMYGDDVVVSVRKSRASYLCLLTQELPRITSVSCVQFLSPDVYYTRGRSWD